MERNIFTSLILIFVGLFSLLGAIFNWEWFFNSRKAQRMVRIFGRTGSRIFYAILGLLIFGAGVYFYAFGNLK